MTDFDGNDYRKRVLAVIQARGGVQTSDPFEYYDVALDASKDSRVVAQVEAVWAFWQKQRDSPKYRGLVTALLAEHAEVAHLMAERDSRRRLAEQVRQLRAERDVERSTELDAAVDRLVERFGGIPRSKLEGLRGLGAAAGLEAADVEARLARHPVLDTSTEPGPAAVPDAVRRQVRADLDELGRLLGTPPPASLYDLVGLTPAADRREVERERDLAAARNRELRPDRRRALVDDLLAAVTALLVEGDPQAYLDAVVHDVTALLRPRVAAAVLVEDVLTVEDHAHLLAEAEAAGLDHARAVRVLADLAREHGVTAPTASTTAGSSAGASTGASRPSPSRAGLERHAPGAGAWHDELQAARAALRAGRVLEAQRLVDVARQLAGGSLPPLRAVADEVQAVLDEAHGRWREVVAALAAQRFTEAASALERLVAVAADLPGPDGLTAVAALAQARTGLEGAAARLAAAEALSGDARELALLDAHRDSPDSAGVLAALVAAGVRPPSDVRVEVVRGGVQVSWRGSGSPGPVDYRVVRIAADGARSPVGVTAATTIEDGRPWTGTPPSYVVVARRAGVLSPEAPSTSVAAPGTAPSPVAGALPVVATLVATPVKRRVSLSFDVPASGAAEVRHVGSGAAPAPGTAIADPAAVGRLVPAMGPGLAVDAWSPGSTATYVVLTVDGPHAVAGASVAVVDLPPVRDLRLEDGRLRWEWPPGCTEVLVAWRGDEPPRSGTDPTSTGRKVTNSRYDIDGGVAAPVDRPLHVAVFACTRVAGALAPSLEAPPGARLHLQGHTGA